jgi:oligopeptide/dipeptide ABC transporter ATP-binding protein
VSDEPPLLEVRDLTVEFTTDDGVVRAVNGVDLTVRRGEVLAVVGESGSGKSVTALALMRLLPRSAQVTGTITFDGRDLLAMSTDEVRQVRGGPMAMIFQDPMTSLNPVFTVGHQISEAIRAHESSSKRAALIRAVDLLSLVGVPEPLRRARQHPHEFSGGMRQRAMIAMAIANDPELLIADEPTTALDVTIQAQVMEVLHDVSTQAGTAMMLITHDLGLVAGAADRVNVMYAGRLFESGTVDRIFYRSRNPYTRALLASIPQIDQRRPRLEAIPGNPPSLLHPPTGCPFRPRCRFTTDRCVEEVPALTGVGTDHHSRCHHSTDPRILEATAVR